jgi:transposase
MGGDTSRLIPVETMRAAWAANPSRTLAMRVRDRLAGVFCEEDFADWFPADGRRRLSPVVLALVSVLQFAEKPTDRQAVLAVQCRIDWKYRLGMELTDPGFDHSVLSEFRDRMAQDDRSDRLPAVMVERLVETGPVKRRGRVRTDSSHVLATARKLNRVELAAETLRIALEELAAAITRLADTAHPAPTRPATTPHQPIPATLLTATSTDPRMTPKTTNSIPSTGQSRVKGGARLTAHNKMLLSRDTKVERRKRHPGRRRLDDRKVLCGILFVLHTGIRWEFLPRELGSGPG